MIRFAKKHDDDLKQNTKGDYLITDKEGKKHLIKADIANKWLESFNLKSLDDEFVPDFSDEIKSKIGKDTQITTQDLLKIIANKRQKYIKEIKETFSEPQVVFFDEKGDLIFAKSLDEKLFFVNVNRDYGEAFKGLSFAPKKNNNLLKKLKNAREVIYNELASKSQDCTVQQTFTGVLSSTNKANGDIIPQIDKKVNMGQNANYLNNYTDSALDSIKAEELAKSKNKIAKKDIQTIQKHKKQR